MSRTEDNSKSSTQKTNLKYIFYPKKQLLIETNVVQPKNYGTLRNLVSQLEVAS